MARLPDGQRGRVSSQYRTRGVAADPPFFQCLGGDGVATVALKDVTKVFPDGTVAVDNVNLDVGDGEFMVLPARPDAASRRFCAWSPGWRTRAPARSCW